MLALGGVIMIQSLMEPYNTNTSTVIAQWYRENTDYNNVRTGDTTATLYQTHGGAFFLVVEKLKEQWNEREQEIVERTYTSCTPLTRDKAQAWILNGDVEVFSNPFGDPPEAEADEEQATDTVYVRVPPALKKQLEAAAKAENVSLNVLALRCFERCMADRA